MICNKYFVKLSLNTKTFNLWYFCKAAMTYFMIVTAPGELNDEYFFWQNLKLNTLYIYGNDIQDGYT